MRQNSLGESITLDELSVYEVFEKCLELNHVDESQHEELTQAYREIVYEIEHDDVMAK